MPRPKTVHPSDLLIQLRANGATTANELAARLGTSRVTVSRLLKSLGSEIIENDSVRPPLYLAKREFRNLDDPIPLFHVNENGNCHSIGELRPTYPRGFLFVPRDRRKPSLHFGIPYFLADNAPQGFLGKSFARRHPELGLPPRIVDWNEDDTMEAICRRGEDAIGNLFAGRESFARFQSARLNPRHAPLAEKEIAEHYAAAAGETLAADWHGSSAAGEQPKFTIALQAKKKIENLIVKFSPKLNDFRGRRWGDLLIAESIASNILSEHRRCGVTTRVRQVDNRIFLEVARFDRVGLQGRIGVISLASVQDEWIGNRGNWIVAARTLLQQKRIHPEDAAQIRFLHAFGALIGNSDRHPGNISFYFDPVEEKLRLAPAYDMLPMLYAPGEEEVVREFNIEAPEADSAEEWQAALPLAVEFWRRVSIEKRISTSFRKIAVANGKKLAAI